MEDVQEDNRPMGWDATFITLEAVMGMLLMGFFMAIGTFSASIVGYPGMVLTLLILLIGSAVIVFRYSSRIHGQVTGRRLIAFGYVVPAMLVTVFALSAIGTWVSFIQ